MRPSLTYLERYRNGGTRVYSPHADYSEALDRYRPDSDHPAFEAPTFLLPRTEVNIYRADPSGWVEGAYLPGDHARFCLHPQVLSAYPKEPYVQRTLELGQATDPIVVSPSSSTRTLYVVDPDTGDWRGQPHALKVHFPFRVSRYGRKMRDEVVEQAIRVSAELEAGIGEMVVAVRRMEGGAEIRAGVDHPGEGVPRGPRGEHAEPESFAFLREVLGVTHKDLTPGSPRAENWGYLVREMTPFPDLDPPTNSPLSPTTGRDKDSNTLVPAFALYGRDFFDPRCPPLIRELLGSQEPRALILEKILFPIIRHWVACFQTFGFVLEPHGQNVLLEVDGSGVIKRIVHRDLSVAIDMRRRRALGLSNTALTAYNRMESSEFNSIAYDKFLGGHFFDRLLEAVLSEDSSLSMEDFRAPCREEFARIFPDHETYLPRTICYFSEERDGYGKPLFRDTGEPPVWRP